MLLFSDVLYMLVMYASPSGPRSDIRMCYNNVRSVKNKTTYLYDCITSHNYDIFAICETWLNYEATNDVYINAL